MPEANRWWKLLRPEFMILIIVPTATLMLVGALGMFNHRLFGCDFLFSLLYVHFFDWQVFHGMCYVGLGYLLFIVIVYLTQRVRFWLGKSDKPSPVAQRFAERFQMAKSFIRLIAAYVYALTANVVAMSVLCYPNPHRVAWANNLMMRADRMVFGTFVPFEMHEQDLFAGLSTLTLFCYFNMIVAFSLVLIALFIFRVDRFREYILVFVAAMFLGIPGWAAFPATTPGEAYRTNKLHLPTAADIEFEIADPVVHLNYNVVNALDRIERYQSTPATGRYFITSFPSMHVAWGVIIVWFGVELYAPSAILLLPWGLFNAIGAIYSLQHYAVDALAGFVVGIIAIYLVRGLVALEARHSLEAPRGYGISKFMQRDALALGHAVWLAAERSLKRKGDRVGA